MKLAVAQESPLTQEAAMLLAGSEAALRKAYDINECSSYNASELAKDGIKFFVARKNGKPVGCVALCFEEGFGEIKRLFTTPEVRGQGFARALIAHLESTAIADGLRCIRLESGTKLEAAVRLYGALGYEMRGPFANYIQSPTKVYMEKAL